MYTKQTNILLDALIVEAAKATDVLRKITGFGEGVKTIEITSLPNDVRERAITFLLNFMNSVNPKFAQALRELTEDHQCSHVWFSVDRGIQINLPITGTNDLIEILANARLILSENNQ